VLRDWRHDSVEIGKALQIVGSGFDEVVTVPDTENEMGGEPNRRDDLLYEVFHEC